MTIITGATQVLAVLGDPVRHSLSPVMHNGWIKDLRMDAVYVALPLPRGSAAASFAALGGFGFHGVNVTVPHKEAAARIAHSTDSAVAALGAANVLRWEADGRLAAFNTDAGGFVAAVEEGAPGALAACQTALVMGAGGAGLAIAFGLRAQGVRSILIANRTAARAEAAARLLGPGVSALPWNALAQGFARADLIVNATTIGMGGGAYDWPMAAARPGAVAADAVYAPLETGLLRAARQAGLVALDGLGMLIHQGALAFELWFGIKPDTAAARARLLSYLSERSA